MTRVLMVGVNKKTGGGMWTVAENYINNKIFKEKYNLKYIPTATSGSVVSRLFYSIISIIKVFFYTIFHKYDILHVHMSERSSVFRKYYVMKISRIRNAKIIIHMHGAEFENWYKKLSDSKKAKVRKILNMADKIIILGNYWKPFVSSIIDEKEKIIVLYNAVQEKPYSYNINSKNIIFLGEVSERKGVYDLINCIQKTPLPAGYNLHIYGPDKTTGINEIIRNKGVKNVYYKGFLKSDKKEKCLKDAVISVLPSHNEGLPMTILETMSYGIPNITTSIAAIPEVISSNNNGILINAGDIDGLSKAISHMINNKNKREEMSKKAYNVIMSRFTIKKHIKALSNIYEEIMK